MNEDNRGESRTIRLHKRIAMLAIGHTIDSITAYGYDFVVYPYLLVTYGLVRGWLYAVVGSVILCLLFLWFYDVTKQDWLGIEMIKSIRDEPAKGRIRKFFHHLISRGDTLAFILLSIKYDAFIVTAYMRKSDHNHTMTTRDWKIFWASIAISNVWWGLAVFGVIEIFQQWLTPLVHSFI